MMEVLSHPVIALLVLLAVLVFGHELGHYVVGRWCGIAVHTFSIGFGPKAFGFKRRGTEYRLSWIPLGGYVRFAGALPSETVPSDIPGLAYSQASVGKRAMVAAAGPFANFALAALGFAILGYSGIPHVPAIVGQVMADSAAASAGFMTRDKIVAIDATPIATWRDLEELIAKAAGRTLRVRALRQGAEIELQLTPRQVEVPDLNGNVRKRGRAGIAPAFVPAILTIIPGPLADVGMRTGTEVSELRIAGTSVRTQYFQDLLDGLQQAYTSQARSIDFVVKDSGSKNERVLSVATDSWYRPGSTVPNPRELAARLGCEDSQLTVSEAEAPSNAALLRGDRILAWNDVPLPDVYRLQEVLLLNNSSQVELTLRRDGKEIQQTVMLKPVDTQRPEGKATVYLLATSFLGQALPAEPVIERYGNPMLALTFGISETFKQGRVLLTGLLQLFSGDIPLKSLGGPILIAKVAGDSAKLGWQAFVNALALISINLALINLFPIPALDGGQLVLYAFEALRRRPLGDVAIENFQKIGFVMIMALVVLATYNDLSRFWTSMLESVVPRQ